eukprot:COSAG01_NODE_3216_length_6403_cov_5.741751_8_plen_243_part_01
MGNRLIEKIDFRHSKGAYRFAQLQHGSAVNLVNATTPPPQQAAAARACRLHASPPLAASARRRLARACRWASAASAMMVGVTWPRPPNGDICTSLSSTPRHTDIVSAPRAERLKLSVVFMSAASAAAAQAVRGDVTRPYSELLRLALPAVLNQSARPLAALVTVGLVGHSSCGGTAALPPTSELGAGDDYDNDADVRAMCTSLQMLAAFSAVTATVAFVQGVFNFLVTVTWAQLGKLAIGEQR